MQEKHLTKFILIDNLFFNLSKLEIEETYLSLVKDNYKKHSDKDILNGKRLNTFLQISKQSKHVNSHHYHSTLY